MIGGKSFSIRNRKTVGLFCRSKLIKFEIFFPPGRLSSFIFRRKSNTLKQAIVQAKQKVILFIKFNLFSRSLNLTVLFMIFLLLLISLIFHQTNNKETKLLQKLSKSFIFEDFVFPLQIASIAQVLVSQKGAFRKKLENFSIRDCAFREGKFSLPSLNSIFCSKDFESCVSFWI